MKKLTVLKVASINMELNCEINVIIINKISKKVMLYYINIIKMNDIRKILVDK